MLTLNPISMQFELTCDNCGNKYRPKSSSDSQALRAAQKKGWLVKSDTSGTSHLCPDCLEFEKAHE